MTVQAVRVSLLLLSVPWLAALTGCHPQVPPTPTSTLVLTVSPQSSSVLLDEQPLLIRSTTGGPARLRLAVGPHRLEVRALGHLSAYRDVDVRAGVDAAVSVTLRPDPDAESDASAPSPMLGLPAAVPPLPDKL